MLASYFSSEIEQYLKVSVLSVYVICVQSLSEHLTDILHPLLSKAIMKRLIRAIQALTLLVFVTIINQFDAFGPFG
jgi:hypothetical protein